MRLRCKKVLRLKGKSVRNYTLKKHVVFRLQRQNTHLCDEKNFYFVHFFLDEDLYPERKYLP